MIIKFIIGLNTIRNLVSLIMTAILFIWPLILFKRTYIYILLLCPVYLLSITQIIHFVNHNDLLTLGAFDAIMYSNLNESNEYLWHNFITPTILFFSLAVYVLALLFINITLKSRKIRVILSIVVFLIIVEFFTTAKFSRYSYPFFTLTSFKEFYDQNKEITTCLNSSERLNFCYNTKKKQGHENFNIVLIIGESVCKRHLNLYGYDRITLPKISGLNNIIIFSDVISPANLTLNFFKLAFYPSFKNNVFNLNQFYKTKSILTVFNECDYKTYWLSNQGMYGEGQNPISITASDVNFTKFIYDGGRKANYDSVLIPLFKDVLRQKSESKKFIVLHLLGSHNKYEDRYPSSMAVFTEEEGVKESYQSKAINHYDNSIRYTDLVVSQIIDCCQSKSKPFIVIFLSDHGQRIDGDISGHGFNPPSKREVEVPFVIWYSDEFLNDYSEIVRILNKQKDKPICLKNLSNSLCGLIGIETDYYIEDQDFFGLKYVPKERYIISPTNEIIEYNTLQD